VATGERTLSMADLPLGSIVLGGEVAALSAGKPVEYLIHHANPAQLLHLLARVHPEAHAEESGVRLGQGTLPSQVEERYKKPSFLVDGDQPAVAQLASTLSGKATPAGIRTLVSKHFTEVQYGEFWTASRAVKRHAGDCSEHAVVVAAVARALGIPARVVLGYVLVSDGKQGFAAGHAWAELHDGTGWQRVDATPLGAQNPRYLIAGELEDEGPSYSLSLIDVWGSLQATGIDVMAK
jgi:hypothetical protein